MRTGDTVSRVPVYERSDLAPRQTLNGPVIIVEHTGTVVLERGWAATVTLALDLILERSVPLERQKKAGTEADPIMLEVFNNLFMSIAEQMGAALQNTAYSVNIKERLDFSCAIFDRHGKLIANAPHMPVHLGSMGESVRHVIGTRRGTMAPGEVYVLNDPYHGGTHLPDVTVITPVFRGAGEGGAPNPEVSPGETQPGDVLFYVASRGHHADIGGTTPGSMPPDSRTIEDEGVLLDDVLLVDDGRFLEREIVGRLCSGRYPARNPHQNVADLQAEVAANEKGVQELRKMVAHFGLDVVQAYMGHVQDNAAESVRRALDRLGSGSFRYTMDDGAVVAVSVEVDHGRRRARIDFSGTSPERETNFNAPAAVCRAAVLYVLRTLVDENIPLNDGCLEPVEIVLPEASMLNPRPPHAVVAGNVETSQTITDCLYGALQVLAASQGTMNNLTFGNERYQYYETICGGAGAGPDFDGADAVHTHMTNSRLTDPEILEWRFPVVLERFSIRRGSGGHGRHRGGDGVRREIRFEEPMTLAILSGHRVVPPFGLAGGKPGKPGRNWVERAGGGRKVLSGTDKCEVGPGDRFVVETPGGGGYGAR